MKKAVKVVVIGLGVLVLALLGAVAAVFQLPSFGGTFSGSRLERMRASPQFMAGRFENTPPQNTPAELLTNIREWLGDEVRQPSAAIPVVDLTAAELGVTPAAGMRAFWLGHATVLVELDGVRLLTDPMFSQYASPVDISGAPQRMHHVPIAVADLPPVDAVVISHDHYDHLDMPTVQALARQGSHFHVGLGIGAHLERWGIPTPQIHEMDWWESVEVKGVKIHCTPARHYSGRRSMDNSTLWSSWLVRGPGHSVYFSGDTGYGPHFQQIRERLGAPQVALLKVGAYGSTWLDIHMDPESAVQAFADLGAHTLLPVHWATFNLAYHGWEEPVVRTLAAAQKTGARVVTPRPGERVEWGQEFRNTEWWRLR